MLIAIDLLARGFDVEAVILDAGANGVAIGT
jgi:hypothetical protein